MKNVQRQITQANFSAPLYLDFASRVRALRNLTAYRFYSATLTGRGNARRVMTMLVTPGYFRLLGLQPALGRTFVPEEGVFGHGNVAILAHEFWKAQMGGDLGILGKTIVLDNEAHLVIGVLPEIRGQMYAPDIYLPAAFSPQELAAREARYLTVIGRLGNGSSLRQAERELQQIAASLDSANPPGDTGWDATLSSALEEFTAEARQPLGVLFAAVGLVLLIACVNLVNLILVRASARRKEMAVRAALGAARRQIIRQAITEGLVLALAGGVLACAVGWGIVRGVVAWRVLTFPRLDEAEFNLASLSFNFILAILIGLLLGAIPLLRIPRANLASVLREEGRGSSLGAGASVSRSVLVVAEVALSVVLLAGAGLLFRTFVELSRVDPGFRTESVLTFRTTLPEARYPTPEARAAYVRDAIERLEALPGVRLAGTTSALPLMQVNWMAHFTIDGVTAAGAPPESATYNAVSPHYLDTVGATLLRGRHFTDADNLDAPSVVLISEAMERSVFKGIDPLGRYLKMKVSRYEFRSQIVGVVKDMSHLRLGEPPRVAVYQPHGQLPWPFFAFAVHTRGDISALMPAVRNTFATLDADVPVDKIMPLERLVGQSQAQQRLAMVLLSVFAAIAVLLSAVGLYGVLAVAVAQRQREFGIRMALGASVGNVLGMVLRHGVLLALAGLALGLACTPLATQLMSKMLYGVKPVDPLTFAGVAVLILVVATAASLLPGIRASRTDPASALHAE